MVVRNREMDVCFIVRRSIKGSLYQMFLHRSAGPIFVIVEKQQSLRQLAVVKAFGRKHIAGNGLVVAFFQKGANVFAFVVATLLAKLFTECEVAYVLKIVLLKIGGGFVVVSINKSKHVLEHARCCTAGRNKLHDLMSGLLVVFPCFDVFLAFLLRRSKDAIADGGRSFQFQKGETTLELTELMFYLFFTDAALGNLFEVFFL